MSEKYLGICELCLNERELCFSHIIPEFMYLPTYDENHRAIMTPKGKSKYEQKGLREYLLCSDCDKTIIGKWETYSSPIVKAIQDLDITQNGDEFIVPNIEYADFKLFQLSLLWRASIASIQMFEKINIGKYHEEVIRKMLLSKDPSKPDQYGCIILVIDNAKQLQKTISSPVEDHIDEFTCYRFLTGRIFWLFFLSEAYPRDAGNFFITPGGTLRLLKAPWSEETIIKRTMGTVATKYNSSKNGG